MKKTILSILSLSALASCTSVVDDPFLRTGSVTGDWPSLATTVRPEYAVAALPGLSPSTVRQTGGKSGVEQTILYPNFTDLAGENVLTVAVRKSGLPKAGSSAPSRSQVEAEMRTALSGVRMRISLVISDNAYGPFGYATGSVGKGVSCVYAWQFARSVTGGARFGGLGNAAHIRLRYCGPAMAADRIVASMQGLRLNPALADSPETLRMAAVPGMFAPAPFTVEEPVVARNPEPVVETVAEAPVRRQARRSVVDSTVKETERTDRAIVNAVKVPMPGEVVDADASTVVASGAP